MGKSVQIRVPKELAGDIDIVAAALGVSVPRYVEGVLRAAVARDFPEAIRLAKERADAAKKARPREEKGGEG
jgi:hypothetical protein